jgi:Domain of unknown function (DUF222)/HNH endonuclease
MSLPNPASVRHLHIDALDRAIVDLAARINASTCELLVLVREFDERGGYLKWGFASCAEWLHWRCDLSLNAARERVRVAHALKSLPRMSAAFASGKLSYSKVRALTRVAGPGNEAALLAYAMTTSAARVEERCRQMRNVEPHSIEDARRMHEQRSLRVWRDAERGTLTVTVELPLEQGELLCRALDKAVEEQGGEGPEFAEVSWQARQADALVSIARQSLRGGVASPSSNADCYQVMIHVDRTAPTESRGRSDLPIETVRRLSCDGSLVAIADGANGEPLSVGRKQRTVSAAIKRALWARDGGCAFPGCTHTRFVDAHHVRHWSQGGETSLENTMLLCEQHHRLVHEGGYAIRKDEHGRWYFRRPDGRAVPALGYRPEDMHDDIDVSAEVYATQEVQSECSGVREPAGRYRPLRHASLLRVA